MAQGIAPSGRDLASQPTLSRLENMADVRALLRMRRAMVDLYCASFRTAPRQILLDMGDTFDAVHGGQQLRLFNAHHDEYGLQPIVVFDGEGRFLAVVLRPVRRPKGIEIRGHLRRLVRAIRARWPRVEILVRADGHDGVPEVIDLCRAMDVRFMLDVPTSATLRRHVVGREAQVAARSAAEAVRRLVPGGIPRLATGTTGLVTPRHRTRPAILNRPEPALSTVVIDGVDGARPVAHQWHAEQDRAEYRRKDE